MENHKSFVCKFKLGRYMWQPWFKKNFHRTLTRIIYRYFKLYVLNFLQTRNRHIYMDSVRMRPIVYLMRCYLNYGQESILIRQDILFRLFNVDGRYLMQKTKQTYGNKYKNNSSISLSLFSLGSFFI